MYYYTHTFLKSIDGMHDCSFPTHYGFLQPKELRGTINPNSISVEVNTGFLKTETRRLSKLFFYRESKDSPLIEFFTGTKILPGGCIEGEENPPYLRLFGAYGSTTEHYSKGNWCFVPISEKEFKDSLADFIPYKEKVAKQVKALFDYMMSSSREYAKIVAKDEAKKQRGQRQQDALEKKRQEAATVIDDIISSRKEE